MSRPGIKVTNGSQITLGVCVNYWGKGDNDWFDLQDTNSSHKEMTWNRYDQRGFVMAIRGSEHFEHVYMWYVQGGDEVTLTTADGVPPVATFKNGDQPHYLARYNPS